MFIDFNSPPLQSIWKQYIESIYENTIACVAADLRSFYVNEDIAVVWNVEHVYAELGGKGSQLNW